MNKTSRFFGLLIFIYIFGCASPNTESRSDEQCFAIEFCINEMLKKITADYVFIGTDTPAIENCAMKFLGARFTTERPKVVDGAYFVDGRPALMLYLAREPDKFNTMRFSVFRAVGPLAGHGEIFEFRKINGKWEFYSRELSGALS